MIRLTPASAMAGTRRIAPSMISSKRGRSGARSLPLKSGGIAVERPGRRVALVAAHAQAADLLAEVDEVVGVAQLGQAGMDALDRLGEQVLVGHRDDRDGDARQPADLGSEHPAGVDDDVGRDRLARAVAKLDVDAGDAAAVHADPHDPGVGPDRDALLPGAGRQRHGQPGRIEPAVGRQPDRAEDALESTSAGIASRASSAVISSSGSPNVFAQPAWRWSSSNRAFERREPERADLVPRRVDARLGRETAVQLGAVHHHPCQGHRAPQLADEARRVEGRAGRQLRPIDEDDVGPAALGEVVRDRRPADSAADDHRPGVVHHP